MKIVQEQILFDCLEQFEAGVSIEALQAKYPHAAEEIAKLLTVADHLQNMRLQPTVAAKRQSQKVFLQQAAQMRAAKRQHQFSWAALRGSLMPLASLALVTILLGASFLFASTSAVPGNLLYDTKRWVESYQLQQADDATAVFSLEAQQNEERIREVKSLLRTDATAVVSFEGRINTKQGENWIIAGVSVHVGEHAEVEPGAEIGTLVLVDGRIKNGHLYASRITVLEGVEVTSTPSATTTTEPTATVSPTGDVTATTIATATEPVTATPTVTGTELPTVTTTKTATPTVSATVTSTPAPTDQPVTPTAVPPTATQEPTAQPTTVANDDNDNDNSPSDNGNDNASNDNENNDNGDSGNQNNGNDNGSNDNGGGDNGNGNDSGGDDNRNDNDNDNDDDGNDNDNDNGGGNSGSGGGGNDNENDNNRTSDD